MSGFISDLIHGTSSRHYPRYHYDDSMVSYGGGMGMLPDVQLYVPMESMRDVERVKNALEREGAHRVICDVVNQTVTVTGNVPPEELLRRVKRIKRHSHILSYSSPYGDSSAYGYNNGGLQTGLSSYGPSMYNNIGSSSLYGSAGYPGRGYTNRYPMSPPAYSSYSGYSQPYDYGAGYSYRDNLLPPSPFSYY
ncbi:hypothetical protein BDL97_13G053000 [Sphagnum fallax]|nr:hypothetical protein BDL97_13G053000 [Sphagnum fallax]